jgi:uncharacterized protein YdeI (YjbR/CyaY-like superfamily)
MNEGNPKVDWFFNNATQWKDEFIKLRSIILDCGLTEELKWGKPCYTLEGKNIVIIQGFKEYCALLFIKGPLLKDTDHLLIFPGEHMQTSNQLRFASVQEIEKKEAIIKAYVDEAIKVEKAGLKVALKKTGDYPVPEEFQAVLDEMPDLKAAFEALTPGRQRAYLFYFSQPKQSKTRMARIEKYIQQIFSGKGLND